MGADSRLVVVAVVAVLALLGLVAVVRGTRRQVDEATRALYAGADTMSLAGQSLATAALIVGVQALVVTVLGPRTVGFWVALAGPAWLAAYTLTSAFTVPAMVGRRRGRRRR